MTTAELKHRDYVPFGWFAVTYYDINFYGDNSQVFKNLWRDTKYAKYDEENKKIIAYKNKIKEFKDSISETEKEYAQLNRWWRVWKTKEQKELKTKIHRFYRYINEYEELIKKCEKNKDYSAYRLIDMAHNFLVRNGFKMISHSENGNECVDHIEIWERNDI